MLHSVKSPEMGWQRVYGKGKQPRGLHVTNQGGKSSGGKAVLLGRGGGKNQAAEIQLAQAVTRAAAAIRTTEQAIHDFDNGSGPAEAAYDEAEAALTSLMTADAALHPVAGRSTDGAGGKRGKGASSLGLDVYRDFMKGKKGGKGLLSIDDAQEREGAPDVDDAEYEEEVEEEEEEVVEDDEGLVEVELEVIPEEEEEGHDEERCEDPSVAVGENEEPTYSEAEHMEAFDDGQGPVSEPEAEEGDHSLRGDGIFWGHSAAKLYH